MKNNATQQTADKLLARPPVAEAADRYAYTEPPAGFHYVPFDGSAGQLLEHVSRLLTQHVVDSGNAENNHWIEFTTQERFKPPGFTEEQAVQLLERGENVRATIKYAETHSGGHAFMQRWDAMQGGMAKSAASLKGYLDKNEIRANYGF